MIRPVSLQFVGKDNFGIYDTPVMILYKVDFYFLVYLLFFPYRNKSKYVSGTKILVIYDSL